MVDHGELVDDGAGQPMKRLPHAVNYTDLLVYLKSRELARKVFELTASFPEEEKYALIDQMRRSSRSIGAQIAEAWAKRRYERHFISKLTDADGEQQETQHWIDIALDCGYWDRAPAGDLKSMCAEIGRMLGGMIAKADLFCGKPPNAIRESVAEYFIADT